MVQSWNDIWVNAMCHFVGRLSSIYMQIMREAGRAVFSYANL